MSQERFLSELISKYPNGSTKLENEVRSLKRKLYEVDFSDIDEEEYCNFASSLEKKKLEYKCNTCDKTFSRKANLTRHVMTHSVTMKCEKQFRRQDYLKTHQKLKHKAN
jgi:uncharacterized Zn-finger protein